MASIPADDNLEVVEIVAYDPNDCENENVLKSEDESDREEQEMEVDTGGDEQENERVQQSSEEIKCQLYQRCSCRFKLWRRRSPEMNKFLQCQ